MDGLAGLDDLAEGDGAGAERQHRGAVRGGVEDTDGRECLPLLEAQACWWWGGDCGCWGGGQSVGESVSRGMAASAIRHALSTITIPPSYMHGPTHARTGLGADAEDPLGDDEERAHEELRGGERPVALPVLPEQVERLLVVDVVWCWWKGLVIWGGLVSRACLLSIASINQSPHPHPIHDKHTYACRTHSRCCRGTRW